MILMVERVILIEFPNGNLSKSNDIGIQTSYFEVKFKIVSRYLLSDFDKVVGHNDRINEFHNLCHFIFNLV